MTENPNNENEQKPEHEIAEYIDGIKKLEMQGHEDGIKKARNTLFATAGILLLGEIITGSISNIEWTPLAIGIIAVEVGVFIILGFWTKTKPYSAIIVGIVFFILLWILAIATIGGRAAYSGIIIRIFILSMLIRALKPAKAWEDIKKSS